MRIPRPNNVCVSNHSGPQIWRAIGEHSKVIIVLGSASVFDRTFFDKSHLWPVTSYVRKTTANAQQVPHRNSSAKHTVPSLCAVSLSDTINPQRFSAADRSIRGSVLGQKPYPACFFNRLGNSCTSNEKTVSIHVQNKSNETRILIPIPRAQSSNVSFELNDPTTNTKSKVSTFQPGKNEQLA